MKNIKQILMPAVMIMLVFSVFTGCGKSGKDDGVVKIGLSFSDFQTERWPVEQALMTKLAYEKGAQVVSQVANHDAKLQNDQIENMVLQGVDVIIIIAEDGAAAATAVDQAKEAGVKVIAYDRLIKSSNLAAYISFDNVEVGRTQARGILKVKDKGNFVLLGGSPTDNNAVLFRQGQMEVLKPKIDSGDIKIVADQWVDNWDPANALKIMENILTAQKNKIDAVVASNDGTAGGAIQAMKAQGLAGKVPISGQDATYQGCKSIVEGELTMTVMKDVRLLTPMAIDMAIALAKGETVSGLTNYKLSELTLDDNLKGEVPCNFLKVISVDKDNVYEEVVKSGFQKYDDVYKDIPAAKRPPRP
ncbi:MAG: substrate-binding domain-containing protein [Spirochaetes bacterium]|nr:substrate-binding domain-containing protein [Spirochaetota bacterium]